MKKKEKLADYTLNERVADLTAELTRVGGELSEVCEADGPHMPMLTFEFSVAGHDVPTRVSVRPMLNQWDVYIAGERIFEQGHSRGPAEEIAAWALSAAGLGPKERPPCRECGYVSASFREDQSCWLCGGCAGDW
jgi:hypothetical protein